MADQQQVPPKYLSFLSMEAIIRYLNPVRLLQVSIESESFKKLAETIKVPVHLIQIFVRKPSESFVKCYDFNDCKIEFGRINPLRTADRLVKARINGKPMKLRESIDKSDYSENLYYGTESCSLAEMKDLFIHLMKLFSPKKSILCLYLSLSTIDCFTWEILLNKIRIICTFECSITWEHLKRVIENKAITEVSIRFQYSREVDNIDRRARDLEVLREARASLRDIPKMIKCKTLECDVFDIFSVNDLINSECKRIDLCEQDIQMTNSELNTLLKAWKTGNHMTCLDRFATYDYDETNNRTLQIIEGIDLHHEFPAHPYYMTEYREQLDRFHNKGGLVIKRETDDTLATVWIRDSDFEFVVWKDELVDLF